MLLDVTDQTIRRVLTPSPSGGAQQPDDRDRLGISSCCACVLRGALAGERPPRSGWPPGVGDIGECGVGAIEVVISPAMVSDWKHMVEGAEEIAEDAGNLDTNVQPKKENAAIEELNQVGKVEQRISPIAKHDGFKRCSQL